MNRPAGESDLALGLALHRAGLWAEAEAAYRRAAREGGGHPEIGHLLADCLLKQERPAEALAALDAHLARRPEDARALNAQGLALMALDRPREAAIAFGHAVRLSPEAADPLVNLGLAVTRLGRPEEGLAYHLGAVQRDPRHVEALSNLGVGLREKRDLDGAIQCLRRALELAPERAALWNNLATALDEQGERAQAVEAYRRCLELDPSHPSARCNLGMSLLALGQFDEGFDAYESRWRRADLPPRPFPQPPWDGRDIAGKTILLHAEQCLGDSFHFVRYAPLVAARRARVVLECQPALKAVLGRLAGVAHLVARDREPLPAFDCHLPLMSLPRVFRTRIDTVPNQPYLAADPEIVAEKKAWLAGFPGRKVGLVWRGNAKYQGADWRSPGLEPLTVLAGVQGVRFVSLQMDGRRELRDRFGAEAVLDLGHEIDAETAPFEETAALMAALDLVIASDTSVPHLAGALGRPTWLILPHPAEWRWLEARDDSPWYPSMRLFRQRPGESWEPVARRLQDALSEWVKP
jgi:tetratricopeptide (TPR) repeat protein